MVEVEKAVMVPVGGIEDLARLAGSLAGRMIVVPIYRVPLPGEGILYFLQMMYKDYYKYYGLPVVYYYLDTNGSPDRRVKYVLAKADDMGEKVELSDRTRPGYLAIPVINLEEPPSYLDLDAVRKG